MGQDTFLTSREVADRLHVSIGTVNRWARDGRLPYVRVPGPKGRFRFHPDSIETLAEALTPPTPEAASA